MNSLKMYKYSKVLAPVLFIGAMASAPLTASAEEPVCSERHAFLAQLADIHKENPVAQGLAANGAVLEVLVSKAGTWTILVTSPEGKSCVVAVGENWEQFRDKFIGPAA